MRSRSRCFAPQVFAFPVLLVAALFALQAAADQEPAETAVDSTESTVLTGTGFDVEQARSSRNSRRKSSGVRGNIGVGGGVAIANFWHDYEIASTYDVTQDGLVTDEENHAYYFITQPLLDVHGGIEVANEHLVVGVHVMLTRMSQRVTSASMTAIWEDGSTNQLSVIEDERYQQVMVMAGLGIQYVFLPDSRFTPLVGIRGGMGFTWDVDYRMIEAWRKWYGGEEANVEEGGQYVSRIPVRGGLDLGARITFSRNTAAELHIPVEAFATHGYVRGVFLGATLRFVVRI